MVDDVGLKELKFDFSQCATLSRALTKTTPRLNSFLKSENLTVFSLFKRHWLVSNPMYTTKPHFLRYAAGFPLLHKQGFLILPVVGQGLRNRTYL